MVKTLIFQTWTFQSNRIYILKYLSSTTSGCKDIGIKTLEFVAKFTSLVVFSNKKKSMYCIMFTD